DAAQAQVLDLPAHVGQKRAVAKPDRADRRPLSPGLMNRPDPVERCFRRLDASGVAHAQLRPAQNAVGLPFHVLRTEILVCADLKVVDLLSDLRRPADGGECAIGIQAVAEKKVTAPDQAVLPEAYQSCLEPELQPARQCSEAARSLGPHNV